MHPRTPRYIFNIGTLLLPQQAHAASPGNPVRTLRDVWIEIDHGKITNIGPGGERKSPQVREESDYDAQGMLVTPGLIDAHTHPVFTGTRQAEFVRRCRGETYQQIAAAGGGILSSMHSVRNATRSELEFHVTRHLDRFLELGVTSIEAKSGYGLSLEDELKSLRALRAVADKHPVEVSPTLLGAHVVPPEYRHAPDAYVELVCEEMIPRAVEEGIAEGVDVFLDEGAFNQQQARRIFEAGIKAGLILHIHADQFSPGAGAELAAEFKAASADHMDRTGIEGIRALAESGTVVVLLPGAVFFLGLAEYAPARKMIDAGCSVAISTDFNPGSSPTQSLPLMMTLGCIYMGLTPAESLQAVTANAAKVIRREGRIGSLEPGFNADLCIWDCEDIDFIPYRFGDMIPEAVFKHGRLEALRGTRIREN